MRLGWKYTSVRVRLCSQYSIIQTENVFMFARVRHFEKNKFVFVLVRYFHEKYAFVFCLRSSSCFLNYKPLVTVPCYENTCSLLVFVFDNLLFFWVRWYSIIFENPCSLIFGRTPVYVFADVRNKYAFNNLNWHKWTKMVLIM